MLVSRIALLTTLLCLTATSAFAQDAWTPLRATCQNDIWEYAEFCGHDAFVTTGTADMNHDCIVDMLDAGLMYREHAGLGAGLSGDLNGDGVINIEDFGLFAGSMGNYASPCEESGMEVDTCGGSIAFSIDPDPANIVSTGPVPDGLVTVYVIADDMEGASTVSLGFLLQGATFLNLTPALPGSEVRSCEASDAHYFKALSFYDPLPAGPVVIAEVLLLVADGAPVTMEFQSGWTCNEMRLRWTPVAHDRSIDYVGTSNLALNGATLTPGYSTCADLDAPTVLWAGTDNLTTINLAFSEPLNWLSSEHLPNYEVFEHQVPANTVPLIAAHSEFERVNLTVGTPLEEGTWYVVRINDVVDLSGIPVLPDTEILFRAPGAIPRPVLAGSPHMINDRDPDFYDLPWEFFPLLESDFQAENFVDPDADGWTPYDCTTENGPGVGDFATLVTELDDIDPCLTNPTTQFMFLDPGWTSTNWQYGPGGTSLNPWLGVHNEIWSPPIAFDLPGSADDTPSPGVLLRMAVWEHLPLEDGFFYTWRVRSSMDDGATWGPWYDDGLVYYQPAPQYANREFDVTHLVPRNPTHLQVALGVWDLSEELGLPGADPAPSPGFDNVLVAKYFRSPHIAMSEASLLQDRFPSAPFINVGNQGGRDAMDIPLDCADDPVDDGVVTPLDHLEVLAASPDPAAPLEDLEVTLEWVLEKNPLFESGIRNFPEPYADLPAYAEGTITGVYAGPFGPGRFGRYVFELPDTDFLYPGDTFRYHISTWGGAVTLPLDTSGFGPGWDADSRFVVHGLPSITDTNGSQPFILLVNGAGDSPKAAATRVAIEELGVEYDALTMRAPGIARSNGIGSLATADHLTGYSTIIFNGEDRYERVLSNGAGGVLQDDADDFDMLTTWQGQGGDRFLAFFGNNICESNQRSVEGQLFTEFTLGVEYLGPRIDYTTLGTWTPMVLPAAPYFAEQFVAYGGCRWMDGFDDIAPLPTAAHHHEYSYTNGTHSGVPASVIYDRDVGPDRKVSVTFPIGLGAMWTPATRSPAAATARGRVLEEVLHYFQIVTPPVTSTPPDLPAVVSVDVRPNPFNPRTAIEFALPQPALVSVTVYNLAGRRIRTLLAPVHHEAGRDHVVWNGTDDAGASVASGVYVIQVRVGSETLTEKAALVR